MPSFATLFVFLSLALSPLAFAASAAAEDTPMPEQNAATPSDLVVTRLPNGLDVAVKKDARFPLAALRLYVHAGSAYESPDQAGISHILEHMVFKGTEKRPKGAIATDIEKAGGYLNAATSFDYTVYLTDMPSEHWKLGLDVLKDMAFHPALDADELESEKEVILAELQRGEDSPPGRLFKRMSALTLKGAPYERPIIGFPETIRNTTVAGMREYIARLYQPQSMLLLVVGDVEPEAVLEEAVRLFGDISNTRKTIPPRTIRLESFSANGPVVSVEKTPWNKVRLTVSFPSVALDDPRAPALDIFSQLIGGDTSSYLHQTYKYRKRLVDSISASSYNFERTGLFSISATLSPENLAAFWDAFVKDLAKLNQKAFSNKEFERAKLSVTDSLHRQKETVAGAASALGYFLFFGKSPDAEAAYLQQLDLVDQSAVGKAAASVLRPERLVATIFEPEIMPEQKPLSGKKKNAGTPAAPATPDAAWIKKTLATAWPSAKTTAADTVVKADAPPREVIDLGNGRTLILQPDTSMPYAAVDLAFIGGDSLLPANKQGLAALTASVLTRGTKSMDAVKLEEFKNDRASSLSAGTDRETFTVSLNYPARFAEDMWRLLHETLTAATLPEKEVSRSKENQTAAVVNREDQPLGLAFRKMFPFLFGDHLYGYQSQGDKKSIAGFSRTDVTEFWKEQSRKPWVLSVCGSFDRAAVVEAAKKLPVPSESAPTIPQPVWRQEKELTLVMPDRNQAHLLLAFPCSGAGSPDEPGLDLLQNILAGQSGLLFRDLRDKQGLGYTVTAFQWQAPLSGALIFYIGTEPAKLDAAKKGFASVIKELHETSLSEDELARGKNQIKGDYVRLRQKMGARSSEAASLAALGRSLDAEKDLVEAAQKITPEEIQALAQKYLVLENAYEITVAPK